jgi:signal peptidase II
VRSLLYDWGDLNIRLFNAINGHSWHGLDQLMMLASFVADVWSAPLYAAVWWSWLRALRRRGAASSAAVLLQLQRFVFAYVVAVLTGALLKYSLNFPRPASVLGAPAVHVLGEFDPAHSFPSGHAMFAVLVAGSLWPVVPRATRVALVAFIVWAGVARVWIGAHFPADVLAGYSLGFLWIAFAALVVRHSTRR